MTRTLLEVAGAASLLVVALARVLTHERDAARAELADARGQVAELTARRAEDRRAVEEEAGAFRAVQADAARCFLVCRLERSRCDEGRAAEERTIETLRGQLSRSQDPSALAERMGKLFP